MNRDDQKIDSPNQSTTPAKFLVVDDETDMEDLVLRKFRKAIRDGRYQFVFAEDGFDALRVLEAQPDVDIVVTDINMPRMDGLTLLVRLHEVAPILKAVIVSAYGDMDNIRTAMNRGAYDFVTKPVNFDDLEITIDKTLADVSALKDSFRERSRVEREKACLARYFSPNLVEQMVNDPSPLKVGAERKNMSFVVTDLAGFTPLVEKSDPSAIVELINEYFGGIIEIAFKLNGTVDKVIGDGVIIFFGAPVSQPAHARLALECAMKIDAFALEFAHRKRKAGIPLGETRVGVNTGLALVGNFGGERYVHYTAYGNVVNMAARLQDANRHFGTRVCVSEATAGAVDAFTGLPIGYLSLKGFSQPVLAFQPATSENYNTQQTEAYLSAYQLLEDKNELATKAFTSIVEENPGAQLAAFHLKRLRHGQLGTLINISSLEQ
jgi:class 3 adenylate cyclase